MACTIPRASGATYLVCRVTASFLLQIVEFGGKNQASPLNRYMYLDRESRPEGSACDDLSTTSTTTSTTRHLY